MTKKGQRVKWGIRVPVEEFELDVVRPFHTSMLFRSPAGGLRGYDAATQTQMSKRYAGS
jgi:hypothetical protein